MSPAEILLFAIDVRFFRNPAGVIPVPPVPGAVQLVALTMFITIGTPARKNVVLTAAENFTRRMTAKAALVHLN
jgi:hypothetical protein